MRSFDALLRVLLVALFVAAAPAPLVAQFAAAPDATRRGFLFEVSKDAQRALLFGTLHVGQPGWFPLPTQQQAALERATVLALEADPANAPGALQAVQRYGLFPTGSAGLDSQLTEGERRRVQALLEREGLAPAAAWRMKPWLLATTLALGAATAQGLAPARASELQLATWARTRGLKVLELEGAEAQLRLLDSAPAEVQRELLLETVAGVESGAAAAEVARIALAWSSGDWNALTALLAQMEAEGGAGARFTVDVVIAGRHAAMIAALEELMRAGGEPLVAVGALHLPGPRGLVAQLRERGYLVRAL
jgi:uncharacterized protein